MTRPPEDVSPTPPNASDITQEVTTKFLAALEGHGVSSTLVKRLRDALQSEKKPTRQTLTEALFTEEPLP